DAPALAQADIGMAVGSGTDVAMDLADTVLMHDDLRDVPKAISLSHETLLNIKHNLFWAFGYNTIVITLPLLRWTFINSNDCYACDEFKFNYRITQCLTFEKQIIIYI